MSRQGVPIGGRNLHIQRNYIDGPAYTLIAYTNAQDSLGDSTVASDLTQPTQANGYAPILLLNGSAWSANNGLATYQHPAGPNTDELGRPTWFPTGSWSAPVTGIALIYAGIVAAYFDHRDGAGTPRTFTAAAGKRLTPDLSSLVA